MMAIQVTLTYKTFCFLFSEGDSIIITGYMNVDVLMWNLEFHHVHLNCYNLLSTLYRPRTATVNYDDGWLWWWIENENISTENKTEFENEKNCHWNACIVKGCIGTGTSIGNKKKKKSLKNKTDIKISKI